MANLCNNALDQLQVAVHNWKRSDVRILDASLKKGLRQMNSLSVAISLKGSH